ncbi:hypothetical protein F01_520253 [Burkholderia cenocepacia]|nr:hypothetical protein F01_520253 [Burkholderia cenocepacia]
MMVDRCCAAIRRQAPASPVRFLEPQSHTSYDVSSECTSVNRLTHLVHTPITAAIKGF